MRDEKIFIGTIKKCTKITVDALEVFNGLGVIEKVSERKIDSIVYKKDAILLEVSYGHYVDYDFFKTFDNWHKVINCVKNNIALDNVILDTCAMYEGCLFVDSKSLKTLDDFEKVPKNVSNKKLVKSIKRSKKTTF